MTERSAPDRHTRSRPDHGLDWRRGFHPAATGLDCIICGARVGVRPDLTERHRRWHRELDSIISSATEQAPDVSGSADKTKASSDPVTPTRL